MLLDLFRRCCSPRTLCVEFLAQPVSSPDSIDRLDDEHEGDSKRVMKFTFSPSLSRSYAFSSRGVGCQRRRKTYRQHRCQQIFLLFLSESFFDLIVFPCVCVCL